MTSYFHFIFTTLDLSVLTHTPAANITAFQVYKPGDVAVGSLLAEWNIKNILHSKPVEAYLTVSRERFIYFFSSYINRLYIE